MNKNGFLVGENDKFTKLRNIFSFLFFAGFLQKYFRTIVLIDVIPRSLESEWVSMPISVVVFIYPKVEFILFLQMR